MEITKEMKKGKRRFERIIEVLKIKKRLMTPHTSTLLRLGKYDLNSDEFIEECLEEILKNYK